MSGQGLPTLVFQPERLEAEIEDRFLSYLEVARMLDVDAKTVSRWVKGSSQPTRSNIRKMAAAFDREPRDFVDVVYEQEAA